MLNPVGRLRHVVVGAAALAPPLLVATGIIGGGVRDERFDAKQVLVTPAGDGVHIREVVDEDFGTHDKHGYERTIPNDFGVPTDVTASSPDASADVDVVDFGYETRIRLGDPDTTISGQHRYVLEYTLPDAHLSEGELALDIIGSDEELETGRFEVVVAGFELTDPLCNVGAADASGGCTLTRDGDLYRVVFEPLKPGQGITVGGHIVSTSTPSAVAEPTLPHRRSDVRLPLALGTGALGLGTAVTGYVVARRLGRNVVAAGGAADAAFAGQAPGLTRLVADADLADLATTDFAPPTGLQPWQGAVLLSERVDSDTVEAWFAAQIAHEILELRTGTPPVLATGARFVEADPATTTRLQAMLKGGRELPLGTYQPTLETAWKQEEKEQAAAAKQSGWWSRFPPGTTAHFPRVLGLTVGLAAVVVAFGWWAGLLRTVPMAIVAAIAVPGVVAGAAYRPLLPVRSAQGSALALQTESFRRFLEASEGRHVDWAWQHGLLRDYTAWAVALGAADAWGRALASSTVPPPEMAALTAPMVLHSQRVALQAARVKPAPKGSSGGFGGGFSGGHVGGGGGGGHSGSW